MWHQLGREGYTEEACAPLERLQLRLLGRLDAQLFHACALSHAELGSMAGTMVQLAEHSTRMNKNSSLRQKTETNVNGQQEALLRLRRATVAKSFHQQKLVGSCIFTRLVK